MKLSKYGIKKTSPAMEKNNAKKISLEKEDDNFELIKTNNIKIGISKGLNTF